MANLEERVKKWRFLVLGGTGFIGPRLIRKLVDRGHEIVCMDINPGAASFAGLEDQVRVIRGDVTQFEDIVHAITVAEPDRIINLAYLLGGGEINPHLNMRLNILGMDNCFEAARLLGVNRVVYASSIAVSGQQSHFGGPAGQRGRRHVRQQPVRHPQDFQ